MATDPIFKVARDAFKYAMGDDARRHMADWDFKASPDDPNLYTFDSNGLLHGEITVQDVDRGAVIFRAWQIDGPYPKLMCDRATTVNELKLAAESGKDIAKDSGGRVYRHRVLRSGRVAVYRDDGDIERSARTARANLVKDMSKCALCGRPIDIGGNSLICPECAERRRRIDAQAEAIRRQVYEENRRERRDRLAAERRCIRCRRKLPDTCEFKTCDDCREDARNRYNAWYKRKLEERRQTWNKQN